MHFIFILLPKLSEYIQILLENKLNSKQYGIISVEEMIYSSNYIYKVGCEFLLTKIFTGCERRMANTSKTREFLFSKNVHKFEVF